MSYCPVCRQKADHYVTPRTLAEAGVLNPISPPPRWQRLRRLWDDWLSSAFWLGVMSGAILLAIVYGS